MGLAIGLGPMLLEVEGDTEGDTDGVIGDGAADEDVDATGTTGRGAKGWGGFDIRAARWF
jgi:hypothetical protein